MISFINEYTQKLNKVYASSAMNLIQTLAEALEEAWIKGNTIYLCGNGGSAGNANHLTNDLLYGAGIRRGSGLKVESLASNSSVITCFANDLGYENIFSEQLRVKANAEDILIALSGSGNSPNIVKALEMGNAKGMKTFAILGFSGGKCKEIAKFPIHFEINDMEVSEDLQCTVLHICKQWLNRARSEFNREPLSSEIKIPV